MPQKKSKNQIRRLSPSKLSLFLECPLCFWLGEVRGIHRPRQSFALQSNMDRILKPYFDKYRKRGLPPELKGQVEGRLFPDQKLLNKWRNALQPVLTYKDKKYPDFILAGGIDDCLIDNGYHLPVDFKTTGSSRFEENSIKYYQHQLDIYTLFLETQGYKTKGLAYLVYYKPEEVLKKGVVKFGITIKEMKTDIERGKKLFVEAIKLIKGPAPQGHSGCEFCSWGNDYLNFE